MGTGVVDRYGQYPLNIWGIVINRLNSQRFKEVSRGLISGQVVCSIDAEVQISFRQVSATRLNIRIREADSTLEAHVLDLVVEAADPGQIDLRDPRGDSIPVPNGWMTVRDATTSDWELYNCCILSLKPSNP